jgi:DNA repair exonuclease SbcCD ATPase subunit
MGMQIAKQKKALQDQLKAAQEQVRNIQKQISQPNLGMAETTRIAKRRLRESEIQQAQVVLAAQDMVDQIQKMLEQISEMQFKDLPALTDSIRNDMGVDQATKFQADATAALSTLLGAVQAGKTQLEGAQAVLTGQAPVVPGEEDLAADPAADLDASADLDGDAADLDADAADLDVDAAEDDLPPASSLGRDRR